MKLGIYLDTSNKVFLSLTNGPIFQNEMAVSYLRMRSLLTIGPSSQSLSLILLRLKQISFIFTSLLKVTQPRLNQRRSGAGSAIAARRNPSYLTDSSFSCRICQKLFYEFSALCALFNEH